MSGAGRLRLRSSITTTVSPKPNASYLENFVRAQYLVTQGFQLLADGNLTGDQWKKLRAIATERVAELTDNALALRAKLSRERSR
jgi:hypothetical protein